jgi:hypothetical protein
MPPTQHFGSDIYPGQIAVRYNAAIHTDADLVLRNIGASAHSPREVSGYTIYDIPKDADPTQIAGMLQSKAGVADVSALHARYPLAIPTTTPNDTDFGSAADIKTGGTTNPVQSDLFCMQMPQEWALTPNGKGSALVHVAIIDTGYDPGNSDFAGKVDGWAVFTNNGSPMPTPTPTPGDDDGHGSNVSGIAAAATNNGAFVAGTGFNIHLLEARVFPKPAPSSTPSASTADIALAINWAVSKGAKVISMSLGGGTCPDDPVEATAVANAISAGVTVVAAAGNDGLAKIDAPACDSGVIAVGASSINDAPSPIQEIVASYSNFGTGACPGSNCLDLVAPGGDPAGNTDPDILHWILNLYSTTVPPVGHHLALFAGTSQATPHVAAIAALMYSKNGAITPAMVRAILDNPANNDNICACGKQGNGRLNGYKALLATP